jgi:arylsulfatase A
VFTDWGYGDLGANDPEAKGLTPHLDELAANGIRFTDFHVGSSVCVPLTAAVRHDARPTKTSSVRVRYSFTTDRASIGARRHARPSSLGASGCALAW